jgi:hypothetical protein
VVFFLGVCHYRVLLLVSLFPSSLFSSTNDPTSTSTLPYYYISPTDKPKPSSLWERPVCYPHPWTTILQLTRPLTWIWIHILRLEAPGPPIVDIIGDPSPWKGSFIRRVFEWNWDLTRMDCRSHPHDRNPIYQIWTLFMKKLNYNA